MLPFFTSLPEECLDELQGALDTLTGSHFPIQSDEFAKGSLQRNNYMDCIRKVNWVLKMFVRFAALLSYWYLFQRIISHHRAKSTFTLRRLWFCLSAAGCPRAFSEPPPAQTNGWDSVSGQKAHHGGTISKLLPANC